MKRDSPMDGLRKKAADELRAWAEMLEAKKVEASLADHAARRRRRRIRVGALLGSLTVVWGALAAYFFWPMRSDPLPPGVLGSWQTADARYADRGFELTPTSVTFRAGGMDMRYPVRRVVRTATDRLDRLKIEYRDTGSTITLEVLYDPVGPTLQFANQRGVVWRPVPP